jgi:phospholipase C
MNRCFALRQAVLACVLCLSAFTLMGCGSSASFAPPGAENSSKVTPIHHVVIVIAENRSFDNLFAT